ncbi:MAG: four helix bundle protein, partial [Saprospiraceae bacterium]|nr:four helix bundle protein [Saprospiraceae bacterium]
SVADYIHKLKIVEEECDETLFWLEILVESKLVSKSDLIEINNKANQLLAIFIATIKTLKSKHYKI